jgi:peptidoglycan/xylan/chitin deacetylase (PgdA/CDA1 family)
VDFDKGLIMPRFITFRFDDGLIHSAHQAVRLLHPSAGSFFLITGLVEESIASKNIAELINAQFGTLREWEILSARGHDIQSHSVTHPLFTRLAITKQIEEIQLSLKVIQQIHAGPYAFCYPYNALTSLDFASLRISAAGFETRASDCEVLFNVLDNSFDRFRLRSWAVRERDFNVVVDQLRNAVPDQSWTILAFHGLDGEGYEPWASQSFSDLLGIVREFGYQITTVGQMARREYVF